MPTPTASLYVAVLLLHLLKWEFQPVPRGKSWRVTVEERRRQLVRHIRDNPSLKGSLPEAMADAYGDAILAAVRETDLEADSFPTACPWTFERIMDSGFLPGVEWH